VAERVHAGDAAQDGEGRLLKKRDFLFFFVLPFAALLTLYFVLSAFDRSFIKAKTEQLVHEQLLASARILKAGIARAIDEGVPTGGILHHYGGEENIYFMALFNGRDEIVDWISQFEGYLPFSKETAQLKESWVIESPAGKIMNIFISFPVASGESYHLFLGYSLSSMEDMLAYSRRNFFYIFAALAVAGLVLFRGIYRLHGHSLLAAEKAMAEKKEKERFQAISGFAAGVAHEIKNPLNSLSLLFEIIGKKAPRELADTVALGQGEIDKISVIVDRFSDSIRPLALSLEKVLLEDIVEDVRRSLAAELQARGIILRLEQARPVALTVDKNLMIQCVHNIVKNSMEAMRGGAIVVAASRKKHGVAIRIEDSGVGIPEDDLNRIFEPFFSTKPSGMGIGLYLVKKIVEAHQGTITVASRPGRGTAFSIELPGEQT
jgi:signal transduction histidine kinase